MGDSFILKGHICHTPEPGSLEIHENAYAVCEDGRCLGVFDAFDEIPSRCRTLEVIDCGDRLILPGMTDLHVHAPQYPFMGSGMDYELMEWLVRVTFPEENRYADLSYAEKAYGIFTDRLKNSATTRAVIFGTLHTEASLILAEQMEQTGLESCVGRVNMDRNGPPTLPEMTEKSAAYSLEETRKFIETLQQREYRRTKAIVTPRFVPCCTDELMAGLGKLSSEYHLPVQSHLSENPSEVEDVSLLYPGMFYGKVYDRFGLFGKGENTVMAHCIYSTPEEMQLLKENGVWVAHCPSSNMNLSSGIAPVRRYLEAGLRIGFGTDVGAGSSLSMFRAVTDAIQVSKLYWRYVDQGAKPLAFSESLYLATKGGGSFFGKAGSFEQGYAFDALVIDDTGEPCARELSVRERLERAIYMEMDRTGLVMKFVGGRCVKRCVKGDGSL